MASSKPYNHGSGHSTARQLAARMIRGDDMEHALPLTNRQVAERLTTIAELLESQGASPFRVKAYRVAAEALLEMARPVHQLLAAEGLPGLMKLSKIGSSLARAIEQLALTGRLGLLERLHGEGAPEHLFATVPGIGREMAARIHERLDIETLAELEVSSYDGRLAEVPGMGRKRIQAVRESLAGRFRRRPLLPETKRHPRRPDEPPIGELLDVDREYRALAEKGRLPKIAPRRFNPTSEAWLSVLHTQRDSRHYTALYSNTAHAHELGMTHDWVVIYRDDHDGEGQWTIVTSQYGGLCGRRIVRGREGECKEHYAQHESKSQQNLLADA